MGKGRHAAAQLRAAGAIGGLLDYVLGVLRLAGLHQWIRGSGSGAITLGT